MQFYLVNLKSIVFIFMFSPFKSNKMTSEESSNYPSS